MTTLTEIETAIGTLPLEQKQKLFHFIQGQLRGSSETHLERRSVLEIETVNLGPILRPFFATDDFLEEMLESRS